MPFKNMLLRVVSLEIKAPLSLSPEESTQRSSLTLVAVLPGLCESGGRQTRRREPRPRPFLFSCMGTVTGSHGGFSVGSPHQQAARDF